MSDLRRLNVASAYKAIILPNREGPSVDVYQEARLDADVVLTYNQLTAINPKLEIFMNIHAAANLAFLMPGLERGKGSTANFITSPFFAAGTVFLSGFMDTLFCQVISAVLTDSLTRRRCTLGLLQLRYHTDHT